MYVMEKKFFWGTGDRTQAAELAKKAVETLSQIPNPLYLCNGKFLLVASSKENGKETR